MARSPELGASRERALLAALAAVRAMSPPSLSELRELKAVTKDLHRRLSETLHKACRAEWYEVGDAAQASAVLQEAAVAALLPPQSMGTDARGAWGAVLARFQQSQEDSSSRGVPTAWPALDATLGGLKGWPRGGVTIVAGATKEGKTSLVMQAAASAALAGARVLTYTFEMTSAVLMERTVAALSGVPDDAMADHSATAQQVARYISAGEELSRLERGFIIFGADQAPRDLDALLDHVREQLDEDGADLVIFDHIQHIEGGAGTLHEGTTRVSRELSAFAAGCPETAFIGVSQLNNSSVGKGQAPRTSDLRNSGALAEDASLVLGLWHRAGDGETFRRLSVLAARYGPSGQELELSFDGALHRFEADARGTDTHEGHPDD